MATSGIRHRIFSAVELESQLRSRIVDLEQDLQRAGARFRWIPAENLHFTVRFLGEITPAHLAQGKRVPPSPRRARPTSPTSPWPASATGASGGIWCAPGAASGRPPSAPRRSTA